MKTSPNIAWPRIIAEGVAIVVSILLAFGIEAWWSNRQNQQIVQDNLVALSAELNENLREIAFESSYRHAVIESIEKLNAPELSTSPLTPAEVDILIGHLTWIGRADVSLGALESALQSGVFTDIEDRELQRHLAALPALYDHVEQFELRDAEFTLNRFYPYINENGSINQIFNAEISGRPGTGESQPGYNFRVLVPRDHSTLLESDEFLGLVTISHSNHSDVIMMYTRLRSKIENTIALIERQGL